MLVPWKSLPSESRLWIFAFDRSVRENERLQLQREIEKFLDSWKAHNNPVQGSYEFFEGRFLFVAAANVTDVSGCSIDSLYRSVQALCKNMALTLLDENFIFYQEANSIRAVMRSEFEKRCQTGEVLPETMVYDLSLTSLRDIQAQRFELPFRDSWHARAFPVA